MTVRNMTNKKSHKKNYSVKRVGGHLHKVIPIADEAGKVLHYAIKPLMVELRARDLMQIVVGSVLLAIPVGFTEEVWRLGQELSSVSIFWFALFSLTFIAVFVYSNLYHNHLKGYEFEYIKRVLAVYIISLTVVGIFMTLIGKCPWGIDTAVAIKRIIIVAFPASMSATLSDMVK